jgi:alpha-L-fucosidase
MDETTNRMKRTATFLLTALLLVRLATLMAAETSNRYAEDWESLKRYPVPQWLEDAKFGIYFHWGVYSVPAHWGNNSDGPPWAEWYGRRLTQGGPTRAWHEKTFGPLDKFGYHDLIPLFKAEKFDADAWAEVFRKSGAKFAGPVSIHHDGFAMWDSQTNRWNAARMGPKKDLVGLLEKAIRAKGLKFICSMHHEQNQSFWKPGRDDPTSCFSKPEYAELYGNMPKADFDRRWEAMVLEVIDKYQPDMLWFDGGLRSIGEPHLKYFVAHYFNRSRAWGREVTVAHKHNLPDGVGVVDMETHHYHKLAPFVWIIDQTIDNGSWGYVENNRTLQTKSPQALVQELVAVASWNGILQLNLGPKADGTLPEAQVNSLLGMGRWLDGNGEGIYGTRPWRIADEGDVIAGHFHETHFTRKGNAVYAFALKQPRGEWLVRALREGSPVCPETIAAVALLGHGPVPWTRTVEGLRITLPELKPDGFVPGFKITLKGRSITDLAVRANGRAFTCEAMVNNYHAEPWSTTVRMRIDEKETGTTRVTVAAGSQQCVRFTSELPADGLCAVSVQADGAAGAYPTILVTAQPIPLAGNWRFRLGDDDAWADPDFDDSTWETVTLPALWQKHSKIAEKKATGWYRRELTLPAEGAGHGVRLHLGVIKDRADFFVNGRLIDTSTWDAWIIPQHIELMADQVRHGGRNVIAIKVKEAWGGGGGIARDMGEVEYLPSICK